MNSLAFRLRIGLVLAASFLIIMLFAINQVLAQEASPSPSPTPDASASPSPDASPSPTPSSNSSTPSPSPAVGQATSSADKQKVLGAATELGSTSRGRQIAKWVIAFSLGLGAFLFGLKILRNNAEE